jgi:nicotinamide-nucleotide amidase
MPKEAVSQAMVPEGAQWFINSFGTAAGVIFPIGAKVVIALPGPPRELEPMVEAQVLPYLKKRYTIKGRVIRTRTIKIAGMAELFVNNKVKDLLRMSGDTCVGIYIQFGTVELKITANAESSRAALKNIARVEAIIRKRLGEHVYGADDETLESAVGKLLMKKKMTVAVAESCTGGLVSDRLTNVSGSSKYFRMTVVAYANEIKERFLDIPGEFLKKYGAVSREVCCAMAASIRKKTGTDIGVGITGIAGPTGGTPVKPVGLVYIAVSMGMRTVVKECRFSGSRKENKWLTSCAALDIVRRMLS